MRRRRDARLPGGLGRPPTWGGQKVTRSGNYDRSIEPIDLGIPGLANIERIGAGGNAVVYRARQVDLDRTVVVKVLRAVDADVSRRRFDRERRAMGRLSQSPGIAPLYGSGFTPSGQPWLLMPYYERGSLQQVLDSEGALQPGHVRDIGVRIARAVHAAHEHGVLHRDLKPANILVTRSGEPDVADFGIAHLLDETQGVSMALTMTPLYTAPEVFDGVDGGRTSDVYSLGALLYALLNGRPAFAGEGPGATPMLALMRRINEEAVPPLPAHVPPGLVAVIHRAMSKDPADRPATAARLADELAGVDLSLAPAPPAGIPATAGASATVGSTVEERSNRGRWLAGSVVVVGLAVGAAFAAQSLLSDESPVAVADPAPPPTPEREVEPSVPPTPAPGDPTSVPIVFDADAARAAAESAVVVVEGFSCTGAETAPGVLLDDGRVLTDAEILRSPWFVAVTLGDESVDAVPDTMDLNRSLGLVQPAPGVLPSSRHGTVAAGDRILFVEDPDTSFEADVVVDERDRLAADLPLAEATRIDHATAAFRDTGELVAVAIEGEDEVGVLPIDGFEDRWNRTPPRFECPSLVRDLGGEDAEEAIHPHIRELLYLQRLSDALASEDWQAVRRYEPGKAGLADEQFVEGWGPLRQGFVYPVSRGPLGPTAASWRIGLIGHETWSGADLTTLFCVTWEVDRSSGEVVQTNRDTVRVYGSQPGQPQRDGFVDPADLRDLIDANCPL